MLLAQISDLHMRPDDRPLSDELVMREYIEDAVCSLNKAKPDAVLVTGDLVDEGTAQEYEMVRTSLDRLDMPFFVLPGNHDDHATLRKVFSDHDYLPADGPLNWEKDFGPFRVLALDSVVSGQDGGRIAAQSLDWLDERLEDSNAETIVALHHPPFETQIRGMDAIRCENGYDLETILKKHSTVSRVICGHHHRAISRLWAGTMVMVAPSVAHQIALDFSERLIAQWVKEPPAYIMHNWEEPNGLVSHIAFMDRYSGAQEFGKFEARDED